jgi:hypothetical protein
MLLGKGHSAIVFRYLLHELEEEEAKHDAEVFRGKLDWTFALLGCKEEEKEAGKKRSPASDALSDYHF